MTYKDGDKLIIIPEEPGRCEDCGQIDELRPYGKNAAFVCFDCAMKDKENAKAMFLKRAKGDS